MRPRITVEAITEVTTWVTLIMLEMHDHAVVGGLMGPHSSMTYGTAFDPAWMQTQGFVQRNRLPATKDLWFATGLVDVGHAPKYAAASTAGKPERTKQAASLIASGFLCFLPTFVLRQPIPLRRYSQQGFALVGVVRFLGITPAFLSTLAVAF